MRTTAVVDRAEVANWLEPRHDLVLERALPPAGEGGPAAAFEAVSGPVRHYRRTVEVRDLADGKAEIRATTDFTLSVPYFGVLFLLPTRAVLRRPPGDGPPWWAPPDRLDARAASVLGVLAAASVITGYLGTLLTQTITYAAEDFGIDGDRQKGYALAAVRVGIVLALALVALADRRGRRVVLVGTAAAGCLVATTGAFAPDLGWLTASQVLARGCSLALGILIGIVAAEEMPRGSRAYAVSVLGMAAALGAGLCVMALPLSDVGRSGWRVLYLLPLLALPLCRDIWRRLPESRRFAAVHRDVPMAGHGRRLAMLAASAFLLAMFTAPASQFQNDFLREERDFSAARISLFTILTNTPGGIGVVVGGRLADVRGRRLVGAVGLVGGVGATVLVFLTTGWGLWAWSVLASVVGAATLPALGVYGPELFPTSLRGRANGIIGLLGVLGSVLGLIVAGILSDRLGGLGPALRLLAIGPALLVVLVLVAYPETAHRELEELNPEDQVDRADPVGQAEHQA
ncbi:MAG: MFS transporter [Actinomycetota bacterium]|nr:MFS transporter [Actinomycetota bacterium]